MKKLYEKTELGFALVWIGIYCLGMSVFDGISVALGAENAATALFALIVSLFLLFWLRRQGLAERFGLCRAKAPAKVFCFYIPLALITLYNLWLGVGLRYGALETVSYVVKMLCVGFLEEVIFRGFLFRMMAKNGVKSAIIVSALTFGIGHIVNLLNGAALIPTLMQTCYATAIGYLFVIIFHKSKSLVPCIITHCLVNSLSVFNVENNLSLYIAPVFLTIIPLAYAIYINKKIIE